MTHKITAVIVDNTMVDCVTRNGGPTVVECETEDWKDAMDAVLTQYALLRGGMRNFDLDALEVRSMSMMRVGP